MAKPTTRFGHRIKLSLITENQFLFVFIHFSGNTIQVPLVKLEYDTNMNGVDKNDQNVAQYAPRHKTMKWYKKLAFYFFSLARFQSYLVYSKCTEHPVSQLAFLKELIFGLVECAELPPVPTGRPCTDT
jgi:hypothetical protein